VKEGNNGPADSTFGPELVNIETMACCSQKQGRHHDLLEKERYNVECSQALPCFNSNG